MARSRKQEEKCHGAQMLSPRRTLVTSYQKLTSVDGSVDLCCHHVVILQFLSRESLRVTDSFGSAEGNRKIKEDTLKGERKRI